jgi:hypothetical protein
MLAANANLPQWNHYQLVRVSDRIARKVSGDLMAYEYVIAATSLIATCAMFGAIVAGVF